MCRAIAQRHRWRADNFTLDQRYLLTSKFSYAIIPG